MNENVNKKMLKFSGICAIIMAAALVIAGIFELCVFSLKGRLEYLEAGGRWSANGDSFAVISMYAEKESAFSSDQAKSWARSVDSALLESSISPSSENARSWAYTYAAQADLTIKGPMGSTKAETIAAGGDYFTFHPMDFLFGSYFLNDESVPTGIVIDSNLAWKVFGAVNIVGKTVEINGVEFTVSGVCEPESTKGIYGYTYGTRPRLFMSYAGYVAAVGQDTDVTIFEAALPNPVNGFAKNIFNKAITVNEDATEVIEVTSRYNLKNRYENMKVLKYSWIRSNRIKYPFWENEARVYDYYCAIFMIFEVAAAVIFVSSLLLSLVCVKFSGFSVIYELKKLFKKISDNRNKNRKNTSNKTKRKKAHKKSRKSRKAEIPGELDGGAEL